MGDAEARRRGTLPSDFEQPSGTDWTQLAMLENVMNKLKGVYSLKGLHKAFLRADKDGGGDLSHAEFGKMMRDSGVKLDIEDIEHLIRLIDEDNSGKIDYEELETVFKRYLPDSNPECEDEIFGGDDRSYAEKKAAVAEEL